MPYVNPFNTALNKSDQQTNAVFINSYLSARRWTLDAISGLLGNFEVESTINPNRVETTAIDRWPNWGNYGFGIAQWTPWYTKMSGGQWLDPANYHGTNNPTYGYWAEQNGYTVSADGTGTIGKMEPQLDYLNANLGTGAGKNWVQQYKSSSSGPEQAAKDWYVYYERSAAGTWGTRPEKARYWYNYLAGIIPPPTPKERKSKLLLYVGSRVIL